jgi:hypothetical protein
MDNKIGTEVPNFYHQDNLKHTSDIIYEHYRRGKLRKKYFNFMIFFISILMSIGTILIISFVNYDEAFAAKNQRNDYLDSSHSSCENISYGVIDLISTPVAIALLIFYIVLYKRRVFLREKYKYKNIGLPMIISVWNKSFRFNTAMVYGLIALGIVEIIMSTLGKSQADIDINEAKDPTGILKLLFRISQVILVGISKLFFQNFLY